jgi:riboflavin synthase
MFTGIIEATAKVKSVKKVLTNIEFVFECPFTNELKIDQSIAHNGVCLTVTDIQDNTYSVTAIEETLNKTNLGKLRIGDLVNIERSLTANQRIDGHFVQGHVDTTGVCQSIQDKDGSWLISIEYKQEKPEFFTVPKGSICLNGISLTVAESTKGGFKVAIIPYTYDFTNLKNLKVDDTVNIEFDILGKYILGYLKNTGYLGLIKE